MDIDIKRNQKRRGKEHYGIIGIDSVSLGGYKKGCGKGNQPADPASDSVADMRRKKRDDDQQGNIDINNRLRQNGGKMKNNGKNKRIGVIIGISKELRYDIQAPAQGPVRNKGRCPVKQTVLHRQRGLKGKPLVDEQNRQGKHNKDLKDR